MKNLINNKKGFIQFLTVPIVFAIILLLAGVVGIIAFVASTKLRMILIGITILVGVFILFGKSLQSSRSSNKGERSVLILLGLTGIAFIILGGGILEQTFPTGTYVQAPTFFYYQCEAATAPKDSTPVTLTTGDSGWIFIPSNTDTADLWIYQTETPKWFATDRSILYQICHDNGARCDPPVRTLGNSFFSKNGVPSVQKSNLLITDRVYVNYQAKNLLGQWKDYPNGAAWYHTYKPFILWKHNMFDGGRTEYTTPQQGCNFPSSDVGNLIDSITNLNKQLNIQTSTSDNSIPFYKSRNFIGTYVPLSTANVNFVTYNNQQGYCMNRQVFAISTVTTNNAQYQIVDSNFNTILAPSVACCPGENEVTRTCSTNFQWVSKATSIEGQCSAFKACAGADWEDSSSKTQIRYNCVNTQCIPETRSVECVYDSDCGITQQCDGLLNKCVAVDPGKTCLINQTLVSGKCVDDNINTQCEQKAKDSPLMGYTWVETTKEPSSLSKIITVITFGKVGDLNATTTGECKAQFVKYWVMLILGIIIIIVIAVMLKTKHRRKRK